MGTLIPLPATGWCVRPGIWRAHFFLFYRGRRWSACGQVERVEEYHQQRLRPRQSEKPRCMACENRLARKVATR